MQAYSIVEKVAITNSGFIPDAVGHAGLRELGLRRAGGPVYRRVIKTFHNDSYRPSPALPARARDN